MTKIKSCELSTEQGTEIETENIMQLLIIPSYLTLFDVSVLEGFSPPFPTL